MTTAGPDEPVEWRDFLLAERHVLRERPRLLFQQAAGPPATVDPEAAKIARSGRSPMCEGWNE